MKFIRRHSAARAVQVMDLGGVLAQNVPALKVNYIPVTPAPALRFDDLQQKIKVKNEENLGEFNKTTNKLWEDAAKANNILPAYQQVLSDRRNKILGEVYKQQLSDPGYMSNEANLTAINQQLQQLVYGPDVAAMKANTEQHNTWWKGLDPSLYGNPYRDGNGNPTGMTNQQYHDMLQQTTGEGVNKWLGIGEGNRLAGNVKTSTWNGTEKDLLKDLDDWGTLAHASSWDQTKGGFTARDDIKKQYASNFQFLDNWKQQMAGESNKSALQRIADFIGGGDWQSKLSKPASQALQDKMYMTYQAAAYGHDVKTKDGRTIVAGKAQVAEVERAARAGELQNSEQVLAQLSKDRLHAIDSGARTFIQNRILRRGYTDQKTLQDENLQMLNTNGTETGEKLGDKVGYQGMARDNNVDMVATSVPDAEGAGTHNYYTFSPDLDTFDKNKNFFQGKPGEKAPSLEAVSGGQPIHLPAKPNVPLSAGMRDAMGKMKVVEYLGDAKLPETTSPEVVQLAGQKAQLMNQLNALSSAGYLGTEQKAEQEKVTAQLATVNQQLNMAVEGAKSPVLNRLKVVMKQDDFKKYSSFFDAVDPQGQKHPAMGSFGNTGLFTGFNKENINLEDGGGHNPHRILDAKLSEDERARMGFAKGDNLVEFEVTLQSPNQRIIEDGGKRPDQPVGRQRAAASYGEMRQHVGFGTAFGPALPFAPTSSKTGKK